MIKRSVLPLVFLILSGCGGRTLQWTATAEGESYAVAAPLSERLAGLAVGEGDRVSKGNTLGRMEDLTVRLQLDSLKEKECQLVLQQKDLEGQLAVAREARDLAENTLRRHRTLVRGEGISGQSLDELELKAEQASSTVHSLELKRDTLASQQRELQLQIQTQEETLRRTLLVAPADGIVDKIYYNPGEYVPALRPVLEIVDTENLWCMIYVPEARLSKIRVGSRFKILAGGETLSGEVVHINSRAEFTPRELLTPDNRQSMAYGVKVRFHNSTGAVKIGMPVDILPDEQDS